MQGFIHVTDEATDFFQSVQNHKRFRLRAAAIIAASCGSVLNFLLLFVCMMGEHEMIPPRILTGCAYIPVCQITWVGLCLNLIHVTCLTARSLFGLGPPGPSLSANP